MSETTGDSQHDELEIRKLEHLFELLKYLLQTEETPATRADQLAIFYVTVLIAAVGGSAFLLFSDDSASRLAGAGMLARLPVRIAIVFYVAAAASFVFSIAALRVGRGKAVYAGVGTLPFYRDNQYSHVLLALSERMRELVLHRRDENDRKHRFLRIAGVFLILAITIGGAVGAASIKERVDAESSSQLVPKASGMAVPRPDTARH